MPSSLKTILSQHFDYLAERITHLILNSIMKYVTHPNIKVVKNVTRVRLHVTEMKSHPGMKKFPFTRA